MADAYTPNLDLTLIEVGAHNNTWGDENNDNFDLLDDKLGNVTTVNTTGGTTALTATQERCQVLKVTGTLVSNAIIEFTGVGGHWVVENGTTGDYTVTVKINGQTGEEVAQGETRAAYYDGTDISLTTIRDADADVNITGQDELTDVNHALDYVLINDASASANKKVAPRYLAPSTRACFRAWASATQAVSWAVDTKIAFNQEVFDVGGYYNTSSRRWTPPAGYVFIGVKLRMRGFVFDESFEVKIFKNGSTFDTAFWYDLIADSSIKLYANDVCNGTDYYEAYVYGFTGSGSTFDVQGGNVNSSNFFGFMI